MDDWLSIGEFARQAGITVRSLRFYEELGLITPNRDPDNDRRRFSAADMARVQNITLLKKIGLSLKEIAALTSDSSPDLAGLLHMQLKLLKDQKSELEQAIRSVEQASVRVARGRALELDDLCRLIRMTVMNVQTREDLYRSYLTDQEFEVITRIQGAKGYEFEEFDHWKKLLRQAEKLIGTDPADPAVRDLAEQWWGLLMAGTGGDLEIMRKIKVMYDDMDQWPDHLSRPFSTEIRDFLNQAVESYLMSLKECA